VRPGSRPRAADVANTIRASSSAAKFTAVSTATVFAEEPSTAATIGAASVWLAAVSREVTEIASLGRRLVRMCQVPV
jgi:hypothetical protein